MNESDAIETLLAWAARAQGAIEVEIADGLAAMTIGDRLVGRGFSCLRDYAREILDMKERTAQALAHLSRALEKVRLLSHLPERDIEAWIPCARRMTAVALRAELDGFEEAQMRAARILRARVPVRIALLLQAAFRAVRAVEGRLLDEGTCLVRVAKHFADTWRPHARKARTRSQKVRERDLGRCRVPGCSRRAVHSHHIIPRSRGGTDDPSNQVALCACHHLRGIHGGYVRVTGLAPDDLVWEVGGRVWSDGDFGLGEPDLRRA